MEEKRRDSCSKSFASICQHLLSQVENYFVCCWHFFRFSSPCFPYSFVVECEYTKNHNGSKVSAPLPNPLWIGEHIEQLSCLLNIIEQQQRQQRKKNNSSMRYPISSHFITYLTEWFDERDKKKLVQCLFVCVFFALSSSFAHDIRFHVSCAMERPKLQHFRRLTFDLEAISLFILCWKIKAQPLLAQGFFPACNNSPMKHQTDLIELQQARTISLWPFVSLRFPSLAHFQWNQTLLLLFCILVCFGFSHDHNICIKILTSKKSNNKCKLKIQFFSRNCNSLLNILLTILLLLLLLTPLLPARTHKYIYLFINFNVLHSLFQHLFGARV